MRQSALNLTIEPAIDDNNATDEASVIQRFASVRAMTPATAMTAAELGLEGQASVATLVDRGIILHVSDDPNRLFIPLMERDVFAPKWVKRLNVVLAVVFATLFVGLLVLMLVNPQLASRLRPPRR